MSFAEKLKQIRKQNGFSQEELAEILDVSRQAVSKWEQGLGYPEVEKILLLSGKLKISLDSLFYDEIADEKKMGEKGASDITYDTRKDLPCEPLHKLFVAVGWSDGNEPQWMIDNFNVSFLDSTVVISAWDGELLVGCVRVLSDLHFRSIIYDLAVLPQYQGHGIGRELVKRCREHYPDSEWLVSTIPERVSFYEELGFKPDAGCFLSIPCKWF